MWESTYPSIAHSFIHSADHIFIGVYVGNQSWLRHIPCKMQMQTCCIPTWNLNRLWLRESAYGMTMDFSGCTSAGHALGEMMMMGQEGDGEGGRGRGVVGIFLTFSASQPRCLISRLPARPVFPSCSLTSAITRVSRSLTLEWMALNQAWAVAESLPLKITVCLASGEWISSCLEKQIEKG